MSGAGRVVLENYIAESRLPELRGSKVGFARDDDDESLRIADVGKVPEEIAVGDNETPPVRRRVLDDHDVVVAILREQSTQSTQVVCIGDGKLNCCHRQVWWPRWSNRWANTFEGWVARQMHGS